MKITSKALAIALFVILFGGIGLSSWLGWWKIVNDKTPAVYTEGEFAGKANPADIRGSYTFLDISNAFGVPVDVLALAFLPAPVEDPAGYQLKELETAYADSVEVIGTDSVRLFTAWYSGLPFDSPEDLFLPASAADLLSASGRLTEDQRLYLDTHTAGENAIQNAETVVLTKPVETVTQLPESVEGTDRTITGKTTFQELLDWGLSIEKIEQIVGGEISDPGIAIKDYMASRGLEFSTIKTSLQAEVALLP